MLLILAWVQNYYLAMVILALAGWGMLLFFSTTNTLLQTHASDEMRGRVMGIWTLVFGGTTPFGGLEAGVASNYLGVRWAVTLGAVICAVAALVVWLIVRQRPPQPRASSAFHERCH
jgi:MFS family permease